MTSRSACFIVSSALLLGPQLTAQELRHADNPLFSSACYDYVRGRVIGVGLNGYSHEWDGVSWRRTPDRGAAYGWCYFDPATGTLGVLSPNALGQFDFHARRGNTWQSAQPTGGPGAASSMCFDLVRGEVIAFGGYDATGIASTTWAFDGSSWTLRQPTVSPPARWGASIAYDLARLVVVLFGGSGNTGPLSDTWEWDGFNWSQIQTAAQPTALTWSPMTYDTGRQKLVLLANTQPSANGGAGVIEPWEYDGSNWNAQAAPPAAIANRRVYATVYDETTAQTLILHSSDAQSRYDDVWGWNGTTWAQQPGFGPSPWAHSGAGVAANPGTNELIMFGGVNANLGGGVALDELWRFQGNAWTLASTGTIPARASAAICWLNGQAYVFGGTTLTNQLGDTWRWNGSNWTQLTPQVAPSARAGAKFAVDQLAGVAVLFGGATSMPSGLQNDTWLFDGTNWQQPTPATAPPARSDHAMAYDVARNRTVLFGGSSSSPSGAASDTWEWDGSNWQQVITANAPPPYGAMTFDLGTNRIVYATAEAGPTAALELWEYDGNNWTQLQVAGAAGNSPTLYSFAPTPFTGATGRLSVVGGYGVREVINTPATIEVYGAGCGSVVPVLAANSLPSPGNASFALETTSVPAAAPVIFIGANSNANVAVLGCTLLVDPLGVTALAIASNRGFASLNVPLPAAPALVGSPFHFQSAALSAGGPSGLVFTAGLRVNIGN